MNDIYIGDGVYLSDDGYQLWLAANSHTNRVLAMEPKVYFAFVEEGAKKFLELGANKETVIGNLKSIIAELETK